MKIHPLFPGLFAAALLALPACADDPEPAAAPAAPEAPEAAPAEAPEDPDAPLYRLFEELDALFMDGQTNAVSKRLKAAVADPVFKPRADRLFSIFLGFLLQTGQIEEAKSEFLGALRTDPELARPCSGYIYGFLSETGDREGALDWARTLLAQEIPGDFRLAATEWLASGLVDLGDGPGALAAVRDSLGAFPGAEAVPVAARVAQKALDGGNLTLAEGVLDALAPFEAEDADAEARATVSGLRLRLLAAKGLYDEIAAKAESLPARMPDAQLVAALNYVFRRAAAEKRSDAIEALSSAIVHGKAFADRPSARLVGARQWLGAALAAPEGAAALSGRFAELMASGLPADRLYGLWTRYFYDVIGDLGALRSYLDSGRALKKALSDPSDVEMMRVYELDAAFVLSDYDGVLALLDQGIPDHDAPWHEMMRTKVLAHRAEADGEWAKAAELFTKFVSLLPEEDQTDPTSGIVFTKTLLSANNHKRAGDLWTKAGDAARAAAAYAVARAAYDKALEDNRAGRETADYIEAQRKALDKE